MTSGKIAKFMGFHARKHDKLDQGYDQGRKLKIALSVKILGNIEAQVTTPANYGGC